MISVAFDYSDSDNDGVLDGDEIIYGFDPLMSSKGHLAPRGHSDSVINLGDLVVLH